MNKDKIIGLFLLSVPASVFIGVGSYMFGFGKTMLVLTSAIVLSLCLVEGNNRLTK